MTSRRLDLHCNLRVRKSGLGVISADYGQLVAGYDGTPADFGIRMHLFEADEMAITVPPSN
jgi:hypothetical protein